MFKSALWLYNTGFPELKYLIIQSGLSILAACIGTDICSESFSGSKINLVLKALKIPIICPSLECVYFVIPPPPLL
jgi:hypothetical protein